MKKLFLMLAMLIGIASYASAKDIYAHDASVLPEAAKTTIANNFKAKVSVVKIDKDFGHISEYEVTLSDGTEISFDNKGNWENVEVNISNSVPSAFVPDAIQKYVKKNQPGTKIVGIEKNRNNYEVNLSNGVEIKFDKSGNFIKYDK